MKEYSIRVLLAASFVIIGMLGLTDQTRAEEPVEAFLAELRDRGYFDTAVEYLESLENSSLCPSEFKAKIPFEKAVTLIAAAKKLKNARKNEEYMDRAEAWLVEYVRSNPPADMLARSEKVRAQLYFGRAIVYLRAAESDRKTETEKQELRAKARTLFTNAWDTLKKNADFTREKYEAIVDDPQEPEKTRALKKKVYLEYVQIRLITASTAESLADTYPSGTAEQKKQLTEALKEHQYNWERFRQLADGLNSSLGVARVSHRLGDKDAAIAACVEIFEQADIADFRPLKKKAAMIAADIWREQKPLPHADIIARLEPVINSLGNVEQRQADWLDLQVLLARAYRTKAAKYEALEKKDAKARTLIKKNNDLAVRLARRIARIPGPTREVARKMLTDWKLTVADDPGNENKITTFEQARLQSRDMMADVEEFKTVYTEAKAKLAAAADPVPAEIQKEFDDAKQDLEDKTKQVHAMLTKALELSTPDTSRDEIASVRYLEAYGYFATERYFETIVIGEYLISHYPNATATRDAASLAVKSYLQLLLKSRNAKQPSDFEFANVKRVAESMITKWPGQSATESAAVIMCRLATQQKDYEAAEGYIKSIPESSAGRVNEELRIGQIYWFEYVNKTRNANAETVAQQRPLRDKAKFYLQKNIGQLDTKDLSDSNARAALSLTDLYLDEGDVKSAIEQLENAAVAPLDLIKQKHDAAQSAKFVSDTYKTAIRVYMAAMRTDGDASKWVQKAQGVLAGLEQSLKKNDPANAEAKLRSIYIQLAKESKSQMARIESAKGRIAFADSLLNFLDAIQGGSEDSQTLLWTGQTLNGLGAAMSDAGDRDAARRLHQKAITAFEKVKKKGIGQVANKAQIELEMERQLAIGLRGTGKYDAAIKKFADLLEQKSYLDIQMDAALTYQMKADSLGNDKASQINAYARAMIGGEKRKRPNKKPANVIWGWQVLCKATMNKPKLEREFHDCLYQLCYSRLKYGQLKQNKKALTSALSEINKFSARSKEMGGKRKQFEKLAADIQDSLGQQPTGISQYQPKKGTN